MTEIYIVRHCEALGNAQQRFQGHIDSDISEKGALQLEYLAERFRDISLDAIYSSPLIRAVKTAQAINKYHGLPIQIDEDIIEINVGDLEGITRAEFAEKYPEHAKIWCNDIYNFAPPNGETMRSVYDRIVRAVLRIAADNDGKCIAIASHGAAIKALLCYAYGKPVEGICDIGWCDNTGVTCLKVENKNMDIIFERDISHLPREFLSQPWFLRENVEES